MDMDVLRRRLSSEEVNALPLCHFEGHVHVVRSEEDWQCALPHLREESVLGFDTETRPSFRKGRRNAPALIQLATAPLSAHIVGRQAYRNGTIDRQSLVVDELARDRAGEQ